MSIFNLLNQIKNDEIKARARRNLVQSRSFAEMLERTTRRYQNRTIEAAQVILELIGLAKEMREAKSRGEKLGLTEEVKPTVAPFLCDRPQMGITSRPALPAWVKGRLRS